MSISMPGSFICKAALALVCENYMIFLERFFRNLLMGEKNELGSRYLYVRASQLLDEVVPTITPASMIPGNENIKRHIEAIGENQLSVKEMCRWA